MKKVLQSLTIPYCDTGQMIDVSLYFACMFVYKSHLSQKSVLNIPIIFSKELCNLMLNSCVKFYH